MEGLAITHKGAEKVTACEIKEIADAESVTEESVVKFNAKKNSDICKFCYRAQSIKRVLCLLGECIAEDEFEKTAKNIKTMIDGINFANILKKENSIKVSCERIGNHKFASGDVEKKVGEIIIKKIEKDLKFKPRVDLESPDVIFFVYVYNKKAYIGIDLCGKDLSKRKYKIFANKNSIKGSVGYAVLRIINYEKKDALLNFFCKDGVISIEAALYSSEFPVNFYDRDFSFVKLKLFEKENFEKIFKREKKQKIKGRIYCIDPLFNNIAAAKKNAKIAGVEKDMEFSRTDLEWLDTKFKKGEIDKIITSPPVISRKNDKKIIEKVYKELFYQADFILKKSERAIIAIMVPANEETEKLLIENAMKNKFELKAKNFLTSGMQEYEILGFGR